MCILRNGRRAAACSRRKTSKRLLKQTRKVPGGRPSASVFFCRSRFYKKPARGAGAVCCCQALFSEAQLGHLRLFEPSHASDEARRPTLHEARLSAFGNTRLISGAAVSPPAPRAPCRGGLSQSRCPNRAGSRAAQGLPARRDLMLV